MSNNGRRRKYVGNARVQNDWNDKHSLQANKALSIINNKELQSLVIKTSVCL